MLNKLVSKIEGNSSTRKTSTSSGKSDYDTVTGDRGATIGPTGSEGIREAQASGAIGSGVAAGGTDYNNSGFEYDQNSRLRGGTGTGVSDGRSPLGNSGTTGVGSGVGSETLAAEESGRGFGHGHHEGIRGAHTVGHEDPASVAFDATSADVTHDATHLAHKTHEYVRHQEIEEVERRKEEERHIHHVQHHVQPIIDREVRPEEQHERSIPVTHIHEKHVNEERDREMFLALGSQHRDTVQHAEKERTVIDRGEVVSETVHHHVHNVIQPIIEKEIVDRHRVHTVIPVKHVIHEAPIVHDSVAHEAISKEAFLAQGGQLGSTLTHDRAGVLELGECERTVDGPAERLVEELGLEGRRTGTTGTGAI